MALVLFDRVQQTGTANTTVSFTLSGSVAGFQSFTVIGNTNTTYYGATDASGNWEVGLGTYSTTGPTLTRTTILSSSNAGSAVTFVGTVNVFVTYPSSKSVFEDASNNVSPLGTISSGTWQATTIGTAYGGTGVTSSSGANSVMLRDANQNVAVNRLNQSNTNTTAAGGTTALTTASSYIHTLSGTGNQTYTMPDATTLSTGVAFLFNNMATGTLTLQNFAAGAIGTIAAGGAGAVFLTINATVGGTWDLHSYLPEGVTWGTNALNLGTAIVSGGTWQGGTIAPAYGGTGLTTFSAANNALYSSGASTLTAGTLPVLAGGTGLTSLTANYIPYGNGTGAYQSSSTFTFNGTTLTTPSASLSGNLNFTGTGNRITGDFSNVTVANRVAFQTNTTNEGTSGVSIPNGTGTVSGWRYYNNSDVDNAAYLVVFADSTATSLQSRISGTGTYLPMTMHNGGSERMRIHSSGGVSIGNTTDPGGTNLSVTGIATANNVRSISTTITSSATITPTSNTTNQYTVTALAVPAAIAIPSGTPIDGQKLSIRIIDNGTARALTWTTSAGGYRVIGTTLPTTTVATKVIYVGCIYNSADSFWDVVAIATQA